MTSGWCLTPPRAVSTILFGYRASPSPPSILILARWSLAPGWEASIFLNFPLHSSLQELCGVDLTHYVEKLSPKVLKVTPAGAMRQIHCSLDEVCHGVAILSVPGCAGRVGGRRYGRRESGEPTQRVSLRPSRHKASGFGKIRYDPRLALVCTRSEGTAAWLQIFSRMLTTSAPVPRMSWTVSRHVGDVIQ
jgi:hypothetical protein